MTVWRRSGLHPEALYLDESWGGGAPPAPDPALALGMRRSLRPEATLSGAGGEGMTVLSHRAAWALSLLLAAPAAWADEGEVPICDPCAPGEEGELVGEDLAAGGAPAAYVVPRGDDRPRLARAPRDIGDLCESAVLYQGWLCDWQGFERP